MKRIKRRRGPTRMDADPRPIRGLRHTPSTSLKVFRTGWRQFIRQDGEIRSRGQSSMSVAGVVELLQLLLRLFLRFFGLLRLLLLVLLIGLHRLVCFFLLGRLRRRRGGAGSLGDRQRQSEGEQKGTGFSSSQSGSPASSCGECTTRSGYRSQPVPGANPGKQAESSWSPC